MKQKPRYRLCLNYDRDHWCIFTVNESGELGEYIGSIRK